MVRAIHRLHYFKHLQEQMEQQEHKEVQELQVQQELMAQLERLAHERHAPLEGSNSGGIHYRDDGRVKVFTKGALRDRLRRAAARANTR